METGERGNGVNRERWEQVNGGTEGTYERVMERMGNEGNGRTDGMGERGNGENRGTEGTDERLNGLICARWNGGNG